MPEQTPAPTPAQPEGGNSTPSAVPAPQQVPPVPAGSEKQPPWGSAENFDPNKAWELIQALRKEKGADASELRQQVEDMRKASDEQRDALARALGVKPEETSDTDKLATTVAQLQEQFQATQRQAAVLTAAQNNGIPPEFQGWLTAQSPDDLDAQAKQLAPMVQATLASRGQAPLVAPPAPGQPAPAFVANPGQGQGGAPLSPQAQSEAGYAQFYDEYGRPRF